jgi:putative flippase GtrA
MKNIFREFSKFTLVGVFNTIFTYLLYLSLLSFFSYQIAFSISYCLGIVSSYFLNSYFSFKEKIRLQAIIKYPIVYVLQYILGLGGMYLFVELIKVNKIIAPIFCIIFTLPFTFILAKHIIKNGKIITKKKD